VPDLVQESYTNRKEVEVIMAWRMRRSVFNSLSMLKILKSFSNQTSDKPFYDSGGKPENFKMKSLQHKIQ